MSKRSTHDPNQDELPLSSVRPHTLFPGRSSLYLSEVARTLQVSEQQVRDLIDEGKLVAINIASAFASTANPKGNRTSSRYWRVPVSALDAFISANKSTS